MQTGLSIFTHLDPEQHLLWLIWASRCWWTPPVFILGQDSQNQSLSLFSLFSWTVEDSLSLTLFRVKTFYSVRPACHSPQSFLHCWDGSTVAVMACRGVVTRWYNVMLYSMPKSSRNTSPQNVLLPSGTRRACHPHHVNQAETLAIQGQTGQVPVGNILSQVRWTLPTYSLSSIT